MSKQLVEVEFARLLPSFVEQLKRDNPPRPTSKEVLGRGRQRKIKGAEHYWAPMLAGEVVPWRYISSLLDFFLRQNPPLITQATAEAAFERIDPSVDPPYDPYVPDAWDVGWTGLKGWLARAHDIPPEAFCYDRKDVLEMTNLILDCIGRKGSYCGQKLSDASARTAGEQLAGLKYEEMVAWLAALQGKNRRVAMFAVENVVHGGARVNRRLGASIILPLTEEAYHSFREGKVAYPQIDATSVHDAQSPSKYILLHSFSEVRPAEFKLRKTVSMAQLRTALYQLSAHCPPQLRRNSAPSILNLAPLPEHEERARAYGFKPLPVRESSTNSIIWELTPSFYSGAYVAMISMLCAWQWIHNRELRDR